MSLTPKSLSRHIALLGRCNVGKSSIINVLAGQEVSLVSSLPGTTTDPVEKSMEFGSLGPVVFLDTAGLDDHGEIGELRARKSINAINRADAAILVFEQNNWGKPEEQAISLLESRHIPFVVVRNKCDLVMEKAYMPDLPPDTQFLEVSAHESMATKTDLPERLIEALSKILPPDEDVNLLAGLLPASGFLCLVVPLDSGAPRGRLIMPQVQTIRAALDEGISCLVCTEKQLDNALGNLSSAPDLVVCDSQVVRLVAEKLPASIPLTTFSILMARKKGDLNVFCRGCAAISSLKPGDRVVIEEACSHHPQADDIGRVKLPKLLARLAGGPLEIEWKCGKECTELVKKTQLIVHCGACAITRANMMSRIREAEKNKIPITNYGMVISFACGILPRIIAPFPEAQAVLPTYNKNSG